MKPIVQSTVILIVMACIAISGIMVVKENNMIRLYKVHIAALQTANDAYERYYCATEEMLDIIPQPVVDSVTCTKQGFNYLNEKENIDKTCHNTEP